jgi:DNA polymerase I-like protein with 3'-5' exonuclease and polymerase domains
MRKIKPIPGSLPLFAPESTWKSPSLSDLPNWDNAKEVALDTEFRDDFLRLLGIGARRGASVAGYSFMLRGDRPWYIPIRHPGPGNVDCNQGLNYLRDNLRKFKGKLIMANGTGDLDILETTEDVVPNYEECQVQDIQIRGPLIDENRRKYSLEAEAAVWGFQGKDKAKLKEAAVAYGYDVKSAGWEKCIPLLPCHYVGEYAEYDVKILFPVYDAQQAVIDRQGLQEVVDLESSLLPLFLRMRQRGVRIDFNHLDKVEEWAIAEEVKTVAEIKRHTGWDIGFDNCMAASRVAPALLAIGINVPLTADEKRQQYSVTAEFLSNIDHPVGKLIRYCRQINKLRTTFVNSIRRYQTNGRIHTTFRQIVGASEKNETSGAAFGRISSAHPNLQQQPSRSAYAPFWRQIYIPEEGCQWLSADFSAQEPRWTTHFADLLGLTGAKQLADMYRSNERIDPHQAMADITGLPRKDAKTVFLGLAYGMGGVKLCAQSLKLPTQWLVETDDRVQHFFKTRKEALDFRASVQGKCRMREVAGEEGQEVLNKFHAGAPFLRELTKKVVDKIESTGILKILGGRHIHFPMTREGTYDWAFKGLNRLIQGTSGYHMKKALLAIARDCPEFFLQLQVHDEACGSISDLRTSKRVAEIMRDCVKARVPWRVECEVGPSWGQTQVICNVGNCLNFSVEWDKPKHFACEHHAIGKAA